MSNASHATSRFYVTTPIYYVNDRPHIGHIYTTLLADMLARHRRLCGEDVFFLTGTDEHAAKVADAAREREMTPQQWADRNAAEFERTFGELGIGNDDFIRTSQQRHTERVKRYVKQLLDSGDVYPGEYEGWYDTGQEEYVPEHKAKETDYKSAVSGRPLIRRKEESYFFRLSAYSQQLLTLLEGGQIGGQFFRVQPEARRNEVVARIREGLNDVPISRHAASEEDARWGVSMPGDDKHTIYVWIDALFNYLSTVDTDERRAYWPADLHMIGKEILWFHAVIWPALLMALDRPLPRQVYAHSFWISEGRKMSKSLGNFIDLEKIQGYVEEFGLDALRWFLATQGPLGSTDADFAHDKFLDVYNSDLANTVGNCASRVSNMINRYFDGRLPEHDGHVEISDWHAHSAERVVDEYQQAMRWGQLNRAAAAAMDLVRDIDAYIEETQPYRLAKDPDQRVKVATILYNCAQALHIASLLLWPLMPGKMEQLWEHIGCGHYTRALSERGRGDFVQWAQWGKLPPGTPVTKGKALFPRVNK